MDTDVRELFDQGFGPEPVLPPVRDHVVAGRRALRRRRVVVASVAAVIATATFAAAQLGPRGTSSEGPIKPPERETPAQVEARLTKAVPVDDSWQSACGGAGQSTCAVYLDGASPVGLRANGTLVRFRPDVVIAKRIDRPRAEGPVSVAVELRMPATIHSTWLVVTRGRGGDVTASLADPASSRIDFDTWAADVNRGQQPPGGPMQQPVRVVVGD
jgi:hypothetical protein